MAASTATAGSPFQFSLRASRLGRGALAGILAGVVFGGMMTLAGMMPMVAALVGSTSVAVGWGVHLVISAVFGALFAAGVAPSHPLTTIGAGLAWGLVLWVVAAMAVMRTLLGAPIALDDMAIGSLTGHLVYGLLLGVGYQWLPALGPARGTAGGRPAP